MVMCNGNNHGYVMLIIVDHHKGSTGMTQATTMGSPSWQGCSNKSSREILTIPDGNQSQPSKVPHFPWWKKSHDVQLLLINYRGQQATISSSKRLRFVLEPAKPPSNQQYTSFRMATKQHASFPPGTGSICALVAELKKQPYGGFLK